MIELSHTIIGLTDTGKRDQLTPRQEYRFDNKGRYNLASFFIIDPKILQNAIPKKIWLTPSTVEDILIFHAFTAMQNKFVLINESEETKTRTVFTFNDSHQAKSLFDEGKTVIINPSLLQLH